MMSEKKKKPPEAVGNVVAKWLHASGLAERVDQAAVIPEWPRLVGPQIAAVTTPKSITANGTLFVEVRTNAWMNELSLLEPELLKSINSTEGRTRIRRIRWLLAP
jgi:predicted nucleic acid-binding Zn ribbon protein